MHLPFAVVPFPPPAFWEECVRVLRPEVRTRGAAHTLNPKPQALNSEL